MAICGTKITVPSKLPMTPSTMNSPNKPSPVSGATASLAMAKKDSIQPIGMPATLNTHQNRAVMRPRKMAGPKIRWPVHQSSQSARLELVPTWMVKATWLVAHVSRAAASVSSGAGAAFAWAKLSVKLAGTPFTKEVARTGSPKVRSSSGSSTRPPRASTTSQRLKSTNTLRPVESTSASMASDRAGAVASATYTTVASGYWFSPSRTLFDSGRSKSKA